MSLCTNGMFWCAFELVFGIGAAVVVLLLIAAGIGIEFHQTKE